MKDLENIKESMPHRFPMLLADQIICYNYLLYNIYTNDFLFSYSFCLAIETPFQILPIVKDLEGNMEKNYLIINFLINFRLKLIFQIYVILLFPFFI